jgi:transcriptional regulator with XRE-family HTH domain
VTEQPGGGFAGLLRQLRAEAGLTQEELAEVAGLSPRSVSDLERGIHRTAHKDTAVLLADALGLAEPARALFVAAARGKAPAADVLAAQQRAICQPGMPPTTTVWTGALQTGPVQCLFGSGGYVPAQLSRRDDLAPRSDRRRGSGGERGGRGNSEP